MGLKGFLIAIGLIVVCWAILMAEKTYGVWVLSAIAVVLVGLGLLRKEDKKPDAADTDGHKAEDGKEG